MLLDIGPKEDGTIPEEQVAILKEFGRWTKKHKEAIYDTRAGIPASISRVTPHSTRLATSFISIFLTSPTVPSK